MRIDWLDKSPVIDQSFVPGDSLPSPHWSPIGGDDPSAIKPSTTTRCQWYPNGEILTKHLTLSLELIQRFLLVFAVKDFSWMSRREFLTEGEWI